jgi:integrase
MRGNPSSRSPGVRLTPSGKWQARYYDPSGRLRGKTFDRKTDARAFVAAVKTDMRRGTWIEPSRTTMPFEDWAGQWWDGKLNLRRSTQATDEGCLRNHILPVFGGTPVGRITRADVQAWVRQMSEAGVGPDTVRRSSRILKAILGEAVEARMIPESPCRRISLPRPAHREQRYLTAEEVERLVAATDERYRALVSSAAYLGCRWGELAGLRRENLDLLRRQLRIVGTLEEVGGQPMRYMEETKTRTSRRALSLPGFLVELLAEHLAEAPAGEFVFVGPHGTWLRRSVFRRSWFKPALEAAGLDEDLRFHDLRHTAAGLLIAQGAHPKEIQSRLGHASITTTLNVYGHLWPSLGAQLDEKIDAVHRQAKANVASMWPAGGSEVVRLNQPEAESGV